MDEVIQRLIQSRSDPMWSTNAPRLETSTGIVVCFQTLNLTRRARYVSPCRCAKRHASSRRFEIESVCAIAMLLQERGLLHQCTKFQCCRLAGSHQAEPGNDQSVVVIQIWDALEALLCCMGVAPLAQCHVLKIEVEDVLVDLLAEFAWQAEKTGLLRR